MADSKNYSSDWTESNGKLLRSALGRTALIGELYDARAEMFTSRSLFSSSFPQTFIKSQQSSKSEIEYAYSDQLSDRFNLLKIEAELQLSILLGLFSLSGNGKYLSEEKNSQKTISCSLLYNFSTVCDKLMAPFNEIDEYIDKNVFTDDQYTHVVVEINWGANCTFNFEHYESDLSKKMEAEGMLKGQMDKLKFLAQPKVSGQGEYQDSEKGAVNNVNLKLYADVLPDGKILNSMENAVEFINKIPELLKSVNDGKGIPLKYVMIPIDTFKKLCKFDKSITTMLKTIDESFIISLVCFFEDISIVKQKLNDLKNDLAKFEKYLPQDCLSKIRQMEQDIKINETKLKTDLAEDLPKVRAGKIAMRDLIKKAESHKSSGLNIVKIEDFIEEFEPVKKKIDFVDLCLSKKVNYLGRNDDLDSVMNKSIGNEILVMYISKELRGKNQDLWEKNLNYFLTEAEEARDNEKYIIVDLDICKNLSCEVEDIRIVRYKGGRIVAHDVYKDYEEETGLNFAKLQKLTDINYVQYKPTNRIILKLICPGSRIGTCPNEPITWTCNICKDNLEYDFENNFYCACGKAESHLYEFRCSSLKHGNEFLPVDKNFPLKEELGKLSSLEEMNILILGQSGVGKSTWINSIVNYLQYDTLEDAAKNGVICVIPANFSMTYVTEEKTCSQLIEVGDQDLNEVTSVGKSATQGPKTYNFILSDRAVRLIDTPGLGDSEGIDKDKENMRMILDHISYLKKIHGICILMKSNDRRIDALFKFCIMELLSNLHKKAARNILFCFTNSRTSFYSPGDTSSVLQRLITDLQLDDMITMNKRTMFCLDNEAFRFLCTLKYDNIPHTSKDREIYGGSWEKSVEETKRLFKQIKELPPHEVTDTTTLCKARNRILHLTKPIAEITETIQINLTAIADQEKKIRNSSLSIEKLAKELYIPHIELQPEKLSYPRTVCASSKCVKCHRSKDTNITYTEYVRICHDKCQLKKIATDSYPQAGLRQCSAMSGNGTTCRVCGCGWDNHMHITYAQKRVEKKVVDRNVENEIKDKKTDKEKIEAHKKRLEETTRKYKEEEKTIMQISLKFGVFLKENAITPYNDGFKDYLKYLIEIEKMKVSKTKIDNNLLENLNNMMASYEEEVRILNKSMQADPNVGRNLTPRDIKDLETKLYSLELTGKQIRKNVEMSVQSNAKAYLYTEKSLPIRNKYSSGFGADTKLKKENQGKPAQKPNKLRKALNYFTDW